MSNDMVKKLVWSALLAATGAAASIVAARVSSVLYRRIYDLELKDQEEALGHQAADAPTRRAAAVTLQQDAR